MDNRDLQDYYIDEMYIEDICAYANVSDSNRGIVAGLRSYVRGYAIFWWPAALTESLWFVYRGAVKEAVIFDAVSMILGGILLRISIGAGLFFFICMMICRGLAAMAAYHRCVSRALKQRGLRNRAPEEIAEVKEHLAKEGKPSVIRAIFYLCLKCIAAYCLNDSLNTIFIIMGQ